MGDIGRACLVAVLDLIDKNPITRIDPTMRVDIMNEVIKKTADLLQLKDESSGASSKEKKKNTENKPKKKKNSKKNPVKQKSDKIAIDSN